MNSEIKDLVRISRTVGADPTLVQGGGGNTSVKTGDNRHMYVKASGTLLKDMSPERGWRRMSMDRVKEVLDDPGLAALAQAARETETAGRLARSCDDGLSRGGRPTVEAMLHAELGRYAIHLHPYEVSCYVNAKDGRRKIEALLGKAGIGFLWVPYTDPGIVLARATALLVREYKKSRGELPAVLLLEKHGLFVSADRPEKALALTKMVVELCRKGLAGARGSGAAKAPAAGELRKWKLALRRAVFDATGLRVNTAHVWNGTVAAFCGRRDASRLLGSPLSPDEVVYANGSPLFAPAPDPAFIAAGMRKLTGAGRKAPKAFFASGAGLFIAASAREIPVVGEMATGSLYARMNAVAMGGIATLSRREEDFITNWEAEQYRHGVLFGGTRAELLDRVAVVTGAGSGLGRSIAIGLARAGAQVAAADIDGGAAAETVALILGEMPQVQAFACVGSVTKEDDVKRIFDEILSRWGGLDILVNAAGVAPAYPLADFPVDKWRFALEINLTGYFLMAREAARVMTEQGMGGSIINISSKSGLDASKNNTAYNATKAGELHMARGWAMELGEQGIRVNCVCPGNVFEGSKIWNPAYIKECAKKYGIRPEEVIPYYVNKTTLRREIKGQDIADSVVFLCSDKARVITGQIIVADSGQAMVR